MKVKLPGIAGMYRKYKRPLFAASNAMMMYSYISGGYTPDFQIFNRMIGDLVNQLSPIKMDLPDGLTDFSLTNPLTEGLGSTFGPYRFIPESLKPQSGGEWALSTMPGAYVAYQGFKKMEEEGMLPDWLTNVVSSK